MSQQQPSQSQSQSQQTKWEADKMLDVYIYDYLMKRKFHNSAKAFQQEGEVSTDPVAIDAPGGFLFEWWSVFWDIFIARSNEKHSEAAASYIETQMIKAREQQQHQQKPQQQPQQLQMQQLLMQRHVQGQQQHRRDGPQIPNGNSSGLVGNGSLMMQNSGTVNAMATKMYEDTIKLPHQRDASDEAALKRFGENTSQLMDPNNISMLKSSGVGGPPPGQTLVGVPGGISGNHSQVQNRGQQIPVSTQDIKPELNPMMNPRSFGAGQEGPSMGVNGPNQGGSNMTLKGWPLTGLDQLRSGLLQQKSLINSPQSFNQLQLQQQFLIQAQQNMSSHSSSDFENRKRMHLSNQRQSFGRDGIPVGDAVSNVGSPLQVGSPGMSRGDEMLMKLQHQQMQGNSQLPQQYMQHPLSSQQSQNSNRGIQQQDKISGGMMADGSMSNTSRGNDQASKFQTSQKRKHPGSSSGPANSSGAANNPEPSPSSAPSTPSTHTPADGLSMPNLPVPTNGASSKSMSMFSSDRMSNLSAPPNQLAEIDDFINDEALDDIISPDNGGPRDTSGRVDAKALGAALGSTFAELRALSANTQVECCHFSSDGKLLVTGGRDKKVVLWCAETFTIKSTLEEHANVINDVRFSPSMARLATASDDRTVRVWDADNPGYSLRTFSGHSTSVRSLDFHPSKDDIICSADASGEIRYWSITNGSCCRFFKAGVTRIRFQPRHGRLLAGAGDNVVFIFDVDTQVCLVKLQGHKNSITSLCWDPSGEFLASVSEEVVKVWSFSSGKGDCLHELNCSGSEFRTCIFHPTCSSLLIIGCYKSLELWNMSENKMMTLSAHADVISSLAGSKASGGIVASASHDKCIKIWK
ncbi:unnamed protein product [Rhodiola kirilowii]